MPAPHAPTVTMSRRQIVPAKAPLGAYAPSSGAGSWPWILAAAILAALGGWLLSRWLGERAPIVVGILHSRSGPTAPQERPLVDAEVLAIEEINRNGGLLGRQLRWVIVDGGTDGTTFARHAERLIRDERADVIVGCWSMASRRAVVPVVEANNHLLVHPGRHEGFEESANVVSIGPLPNQQIAPAVAWCREAMSARRFFLVGTDDAWSRAAGAFLGDQLSAIGATLVGEEYLPSGTLDVAPGIEGITAANPDVVFSLLGGEASAALLRQLRESGVRPADVPVMMFGIGEDELRAIPREDVSGNYVVSGHFPGGDRASSQSFFAAFRARYGNDRPTSEQAMAAYEAVRLWADAVREAGTANVGTVRSTIDHQTLPSAEGVIAIDPESRHAWRNLAVGRVRGDGQVETLWSTRGPTRPTPFPSTRSHGEWTKFLALVQREKAARRAVTAPEPRPGATP